MSSEKITSRHNALVKHARDVRDGKEQEQIFIEGLRLAEEALYSHLSIQAVLYTERLQDDARGARLLNELSAEGHTISLTSDDVLAFASDTRTAQGIILLATRPHASTNALLTGSKSQSLELEMTKQHGHIESPLIVIIHGINNPSNAGAILRTAEAAGASGAISTRGTTDIFSPKALRGAMGSSFRLPLWTGADFVEAIEWCKENGIGTIGATLSAAQAHTEADWTHARALVVGSEAAGLSESEAAMLDETIRIPMRPPVESLNVAVASGIILYEAARQRR
jgi:TrmH family RNA methyltransferase